MGKSWQDEPRKANSLLELLHEGLANVHRGQRKQAAEKKGGGGVEMYSKRRDRRLKCVPSSEVSARAFLYSPVPV